MAFTRGVLAVNMTCSSTNLLKLIKILPRPSYFSVVRNCSSETSQRGLVLGVYYNEANQNEVGVLTPAAKHFNDISGGKLIDHLKMSFLE